jgi:hypothetical protein
MNKKFVYQVGNNKKVNFILVIDTAVQNNDNEISLRFKPMRLIFMN